MSDAWSGARGSHTDTPDFSTLKTPNDSVSTDTHDFDIIYYLFIVTEKCWCLFFTLVLS